MNQILTDEEISEVFKSAYHQHHVQSLREAPSWKEYARAIEQAILNKLSEHIKQLTAEREAQAAEIEKYKALCDQMGNALAKCRYDSLNMSIQDMAKAGNAFNAWRAMK